MIGRGSPHATAGLHTCTDKHLRPCRSAQHVQDTFADSSTFQRPSRSQGLPGAYASYQSWRPANHLRHVGCICKFKTSFARVYFHCKSKTTLVRGGFLLRATPPAFEVCRIAARCGMCLMRIAKQASHSFVVGVLQSIKSRRQFRVARCARPGLF